MKPWKVETWATVPGWPDVEVSTSGRVRIEGQDVHVIVHGSTGYRFLKYRNSKLKIPHLMLLTFIGPRPSKKHVARHLNDKKWDDRIENLAWGTAKDNYEDSIKNGAPILARRRWKI